MWDLLVFILLEPRDLPTQKTAAEGGTCKIGVLPKRLQKSNLWVGRRKGLVLLLKISSRVNLQS